MYDLRAPRRNYEGLYNGIRSYGTWGKLTESTWAILSHQNPGQIRDYLFQFIDSNDRLFVVKSSGDAAWHNALADNDWIKRNIPTV